MKGWKTRYLGEAEAVGIDVRPTGPTIDLTEKDNWDEVIVDEQNTWVLHRIRNFKLYEPGSYSMKMLENGRLVVTKTT